MPLKRLEPTLARCKATTSSGACCKAKPHEDGLCFFHSDPRKAAELGRKGGRRNRHTYETPLQHVAAPESVGDVKRMLAESMAEVRAGKDGSQARQHTRLSGYGAATSLRGS
jgi:Family of unknown function (DUF5763)